LWNVATGERLAVSNDGGESLAFSPNGRLLAVASGYGTGDASVVRVRNAESLRLESRIAGIKHKAHVVTFAADSRRIAVGTAFPGTAELWDVVDMKRIAFLDPNYEFISGLVFIDEKTIAVTGRGMSRPPILLWDISNPGLLPEYDPD
jgi:WD40 repeat protein